MKLIIILYLLMLLLSINSQQLLYIDTENNIVVHNDINRLNSNQQNALISAQKSDPTSLNNVGLAFLQDTTLGNKNISLAMMLFEKAVVAGSIAAAYNLGNLYFEGVELQQNKRLALQWFEIAGHNGHHQGALYNIGLLFAQGFSNVNIFNDPSIDFLTALEYFRAAYLTTDPSSSSSLEIKDAAFKSHSIISDKLVTTSNHDFTILKRLWYSSSLTLQSNTVVDEIFENSIKLLTQFNESFVMSKGVITNSTRSLMHNITNLLGSLAENHLKDLNNIQMYIVLDNINDMLGPLAGKSNEFVHLAGIYSESLALTHYCYNKYAIKESDAGCFNGAVSAAVSYFRRSSNSSANANISRVFQLATNHPHAKTKWIHESQTPRVFHEELISQPWWNPDDFELVKELKNVYKNNFEDIQAQLDEVIALNEGSLRVGGSVTETKAIDESTGLQRIFTPYIGVRSNDDGEQKGSGAWSEFGPLFDGISWSLKCQKIPLICDVLKRHSHKEICGSAVISDVDFNGDPMRISAIDIENTCGSDTVATILRLRPHTRILPHCGTTNRRLIMHFALRGSTGVKFRVGEEWSEYGGDGNAIVFDDSYEHEVYHGGEKDRFVLLVVLAHPQTK